MTEYSTHLIMYIYIKKHSDVHSVPSMGRRKGKGKGKKKGKGKGKGKGAQSSTLLNASSASALATTATLKKPTIELPLMPSASQISSNFSTKQASSKLTPVLPFSASAPVPPLVMMREDGKLFDDKALAALAARARATLSSVMPTQWCV